MPPCPDLSGAPRWRRWVLRFAGLLLVLYAVALAALYLDQARLLYHPTTDIRPPAEYGLPEMRVATLRQPLAVDIQLWYAAAPPGGQTIVYFHGNGGNLSDNRHYFRALIDAGYGVVAVDYRGFGTSGGIPGEAGILDDARATLGFAEHHLHVAPAQTILFGVSLGTGVAVRMAAEMAARKADPAMLVLQSPYTSVADRAAELYWYVPVHWLIRDPFASESYIRTIHTPLLLLHGEEDAVIPAAHGHAMLAAAPEPKRGVFYPNIHHDDFDIRAIIREMQTTKRDKLP